MELILDRPLTEDVSTEVLRDVKLVNVENTIGVVDADDTLVSLALLANCSEES